MKKNLKSKGWSDKEIDKTAKILERNEKHKYVSIQFSRLLYWMSLLVLTVCNFLIAVVLVPFILMLSSTQVYFAVGLLALVFGLLFNFLIRDIEHLEPEHHGFALLFIPIVSLVNLYLMLTVAGKLANALHIVHPNHSMLRISLVYLIVFVIPFILGVMKDHLKSRNVD